MADPNVTPPKVSNNISPLAIIIAVALVVLVIFAFMKMRGHHVTPSGADSPMAQSGGNVVMPQQPNLPNTLQPAANTNDASEAQPTGNETGAPYAAPTSNATRGPG